MELPLNGVSVLGMAPWLPGLYCNMLLADLGADVILIERPDGRERAERPPGYLSIINRNKKSMTLNLKSVKGKEVFTRLVAGSDVFMEGFRPGTVTRMGIDYQSLKTVNPGIVYCSITGYGQDSPYKEYPGHNNTYMGVAGMVHSLPDAPLEYSSNVSIGDLAGSMFAALSIVAALRVRERNGEGQYIEAPITDCALSWMSPNLGVFFATGGLRPEPPATNFYRTSDGKYMSLSTGATDSLWRNLCRAIGLDELANLSHVEREARFEGLEEAVRRTISRRTRDEWLALLHEADVPCGPALTLGELKTDPHIRHRGLMPEIDDRAGAKVQQVAYPVRFSETPATIRRPAPALGELTEEILSDLGYSEHEIRELISEGAV